MKRRLGLILRIVGGLALLGFVVSQIQFRDRYVTATGETVVGRIVERTERELVFRTDEERIVPLEEIETGLRLREEEPLRGRPVRLETGAPPDVVSVLPLAVSPRSIRVLLPDGTVRKTDRGPGTLVFRPRGAEPREIPLAEVVDLQPEIEEGLLTIGARLAWPLTIGSSLLFFAISWIGVWRWRYLMATQGLRVTLAESFRLTYLGFFFNNVVPGMTGGDLVKAFYIARRSPSARATAAVSVFVDRIIGIVGLAFLGGAVLLFRLGDPEFRAAGLVIYLFLAATAAGGIAFFSRRVRRLLRIDRLLAAIPGAPGAVLRKVDAAFFAYREHRMALLVAFVLSIVNHAGLMVMNIGFARALGIDEVPVSAFFVLIPVVMMISSIPLLPGGWGIGEFAYATFLGHVGVPFTQAIALSFVFRISNLLWSLLGGVFFMTEKDRATQADLAREAELEEAAVAASPTPGDPETAPPA